MSRRRWCAASSYGRPTPGRFRPTWRWRADSGALDALDSAPPAWPVSCSSARPPRVALRCHFQAARASASEPSIRRLRLTFFVLGRCFGHFLGSFFLFHRFLGRALSRGETHDQLVAWRHYLDAFRHRKIRDEDRIVDILES